MYYELSDAAYLLQGQPMFKMLAKIKEMERAGEDIIHFEIGDPDFSTPQNVIDAGTFALNNGFTHYSDSMGDYDFRAIVAENNLHTRGFRPDIDQVLVTPGANMMIYYAVLCLVNPGDEVIVQDPCFPTYLSVFHFCGVRPVCVPLYEENEFRLDPKDLEDRITDKTRLIIVNSPHNPTGAVMRPEELEMIGRIALKHRIYLYSDEIYSRMNYGDIPFYSPSILDRCKEFVIVANGFSKAFAMTGWRLGYACGPEPIIEQMIKIHQFAIMCAPTTSQYAAIEALKNGDEDVAEMCTAYNQRRRYLVHCFKEMGLECFEPYGAFYIFPCIKEFGMSSDDFAMRFLKEEKVAVVPGNAFGDCGEGYLRISYASSLENLKIAMGRLAEFIGRLRA